MRLVDELTDLLQALDGPHLQRVIAEPIRSSMRRSLTEARRCAAAGDDRAALRALEVAAHDVADVWPFDEPTGARVLALAQVLRREDRRPHPQRGPSSASAAPSGPSSAAADGSLSER